MPTRKQRRRRDKERRHEWEEVYVDEEGRELAPDEAELLAQAGGRGRENGHRPAAGRAGAGRKVVEPPSWRRVAKRALIFAPFMFLVITFLDSETTLLARALYTGQLMLLFIPFSYVVDSFAYRMYRRRVGDEAGPRKT
jgi:hypothetical protein